MLTLQEPLSLPHKLYRAEQVREHEPAAAKNSHCDMYSLMVRAGTAVLAHCQLAYPQAAHYLVLVGNGNNAGDGYIVATQAMAAGKHVVVCAANADKALHGDARRAQQAFIDAGGSVQPFSRDALQQANLVVDGLLGTGIDRQVSAAFAFIIDSVNASELPVVSIDLPSGLQANTGQPLGCCIQAATTVTFVGIKLGLVTGIGKHYCGQLVFDDLGVGEAFQAIAQHYASLISLPVFNGPKSRPTHAHKGNFGRLLCIGGNSGTGGAIRLTAEAALRTGAGLVKVYTHASSMMQVGVGCPELMVGSDQLEKALNWATSIVIGPGLGIDEWAQCVFAQTLLHCEKQRKPIVLDADALNLLSQSAVSYNLTDCLITPHAAEAARLLKTSVEAVEADRFGSTRALSQGYLATCVLKGAGSIIDTQQHAYVCQHGNPGMATAGMGDVLTGVLGALLAQGSASDIAAMYGVCLHAMAGDSVADQYGERGIMASDLFPFLRKLINPMKKQASE